MAVRTVLMSPSCQTTIPDIRPTHPEYIGIIDHSEPDYPLAEHLELGAEQIKVLFEETRLAIADLLTDRPATVTELAGALNRPKGTIAHHIARLEEAGLVEVVRTRKVRAIEERFYGRTARTFLLDALTEAGVSTDIFFHQALAELPAGKNGLVTLRHARIPTHRAAEWARRLGELVDEFVAQPRSGRKNYGLLIALYPTDRPTLAEKSE
ncbi:MAG TPA: winged helix-turn-helix domain-containing protein [Acidimicrobiia bacterium]|nr:winged helix-turn-helix domain-containing protein [Acidimicrobiia bacterium]